MGNIKKSFTLAETLITLAIIGVIAALTIPTLAKKYQAAQLRSAFFVANSIVMNTSGLIVKDGVDISDLTPEEISKYFKSDNFQTKTRFDNKYKSFGDVYNASGALATQLRGEFDLPNGMIGLIIFNGYDANSRLIGIDVNGKNKKPNRYGHDVFFWYQNPITRQFEITGSMNTAKYTSTWYTKCFADDIASGAHENGIGCGAKALSDPDWFNKLPK